MDITLPSGEGHDARTPPRNRTVRWFELWFAWFAIAIYGGAITFPLRMLRGAGGQLPGESDPVMAACQTVILGLVMYALVTRYRRLLPLLRLMTPFLLLLGLCFLSVLWSDHPAATLRRSATLGICLMYGVYCFDVFGPTRLIGMVLHVMILLGILSIIVFAAVPSIGHETAINYVGAMRGVFSQKNGLAECMLLAITCSAYRLLEERRVIEFSLAVPLLVGCIILSASATSFMTACVILLATGFLYLRPWPRARALYTYGLGSAALIVLAVLVFSPETVLNAMGRDTSLTGRLPLWQAISGIIAERPFLGHGYSGFWDAASPAVQDLWQRVGWQAPDAHNGYLDIMIQLGVAGAGLYALIWGRIIYLALQARRSRTLPAASWILLLMLVNILVNMEEGPLPWADVYTLVMPSTLIIVEIWNETARRLPIRTRLQQGSVYLDLSPFDRVRAVSRPSQAGQDTTIMSRQKLMGNGD